MLSPITRHVTGDGWFLIFVQVSTALILALAANTSFADFPRLSSFLARDGFMPRQFGFRGERLAFTTGIVALSAWRSSCWSSSRRASPPSFRSTRSASSWRSP